MEGLRMDPGARTGQVRIPSSKSVLHRMLILASLAKEPSAISFRGLSKDIEATADCLSALGSRVDIAYTAKRTGEIRVQPFAFGHVPKGAVLLCRESGSTLRFLLPLCGVLGASGRFEMEGRLSERPLAPFDEELCKGGMILQKQEKALSFSGRLRSGFYEIPGNISSQYISGLLMAFCGLPEGSEVLATGKLESEPYIRMTQSTIEAFGGKTARMETARGTVFRASAGSGLSGGCYAAEGDYSCATFFLCMGALSREGIEVYGLDPASAQGDKKVLDILKDMGAVVEADPAKEVLSEGDTAEESKSAGRFVRVRRGSLRGTTIDASQIPDAVPALAALAAFGEGQTVFTNVSRLRLKESDRVESTASMLRAAGADAQVQGDSIVVSGKSSLPGGAVRTYSDHRIAMASAVLASGGCEVSIDDSACVSKSYPDFWKDLEMLKKEAQHG